MKSLRTWRTAFPKRRRTRSDRSLLRLPGDSGPQQPQAKFGLSRADVLSDRPGRCSSCGRSMTAPSRSATESACIPSASV